MSATIKKNNFLLNQSDQKDTVEEWYSGEGQLLCDVYENGDCLIIKSTIAGVDPKDLDIAVAHDVLTIRGVRQMDEDVSEEKFYVRECYWGSFSRSIVLPHEIDQKKVSASLKNGVLTVKLPKKYKTSSIRIRQSNG